MKEKESFFMGEKESERMKYGDFLKKFWFWVAFIAIFAYQILKVKLMYANLDGWIIGGSLIGSFAFLSIVASLIFVFQKIRLHKFK